MSEETRQPAEETPEEQTAEPRTEAPQEETPAPQEQTAGETAGKAEKARGKKKKEKTYTLTQAQMEAAELAARQLESVKDQFVRLTAEYDNYRKRTAKEKEAIYPEAKASTLASILPILDSLERALAVPCSDEEFKKGLELIHKSFDEVLQKHGVEAFGEVGDLFDPGMYAAVAHVDDEAAGENSVAEVFQKGYKMGDRILRYAMVKVAN